MMSRRTVRGLTSSSSARVLALGHPPDLMARSMAMMRARGGREDRCMADAPEVGGPTFRRRGGLANRAYDHGSGGGRTSMGLPQNHFASEADFPQGAAGGLALAVRPAHGGHLRRSRPALSYRA